MISFIFLVIFSIWILINRFSEGGKVEGYPLGMPRGTIRALLAIMLVAFPFWNIIRGKEIPSLIVNIIFIVVAFYFEARRSEHERLKQIINEVKNPDTVFEDLRKEKRPLYLPKYSVRFLLVLMLLIVQIMIILQPTFSFQVTNTLTDLLLIIVLFIIGASFRSILQSREKKKTKEKIANMDSSLSDIQIIETLMLERPNKWKRLSKSILSILMLTIVSFALLCYTYDWDYTIFTIPSYELTLVGALLLLVNVYYGFRE